MVGEACFFRGEGTDEGFLADKVLALLRSGSAPSASLADVEEADAVLVLGEDVTNTAPMLDLALRQAVRSQPLRELREDGVIPMWNDAAVREAIQNRKGPLFLATPCPTKLDSQARAVFRAAPEDIARLGRAVAREIDSRAEPVPDLSEELARLAKEVADALKAARRPLVVSGTSLGSAHVLDAAGAVSDAIAVGGKEARIFLVLPEPNSMGAALLGGRTLKEAFQRIEEGDVEAVVVLENDLFRRAPREEVERFLAASPFTIAMDCVAHETGERADLVLPVATFAEGDGTLVNNEGRAQRFFRVFVPQEGDVRESWRWLAAGGAFAGMDAPANHDSGGAWMKLDELQEALVQAYPALASVRDASPPRDFRVGGARVPREPHRYSGRTAMRADQEIHEPPPPQDRDSPLSFSMEGYQGAPPPKLASHFWAPGWNSIQALNRFQEEVGGPLRGETPGSGSSSLPAKACSTSVGRPRPPSTTDFGAGDSPTSGEPYPSTTVSDPTS